MCPKIYRLLIKISTFLSVFIFLVISPQTSLAFPRSSYYDFGPYYNNQQQILGVTLSSLENLPILQIQQEALIPKALGILPGNPLRPFEAFIENVQLAFTLDPIKKEELRLDFASERLSEAKTLLDQGKHDLATVAIENYSDTMATISENIEDLTTKNVPGADSLVAKVETMAASQSVAAMALTLSSPPVVSQAWNQVVDAAEKSIDAAADASNKPPIPDELSASLQELKDQGLITPEESNKLYSLDSRVKVREELDMLATSGQFPIAEIAKLDEAVAVAFPDAYKQTVDILQFAELRIYQTESHPPDEALVTLRRWQEGPGNVPPPEEIRQYLYYTRAQELAREIDLTKFASNQQGEVARFYPQAVLTNPTFVEPPPVSLPTPTISPSDQTTSTKTEESTPTPFPTPKPASADPYLTTYQGSLPGNPVYFLKQLREIVSFETTFDAARRAEIRLRYAQERLREASALSQDPKKEALYIDTLKRYKDSIVSASDQIERFTGPAQRQKDLARNLEFEAARHNIIFEKGLLPAPKKTVIIGDVIMETEDAMDIAADILHRPPLPEAVINLLQYLKV